MTSLKPVFARVLLKRETLKSRGGIIIPDVAGAKHAHDHGEVVAVGPSCDASIQPGMIVVFGKYAGAWIKLPDSPDELYVCNDEDILCIVEKPNG